MPFLFATYNLIFRPRAYLFSLLAWKLITLCIRRGTRCFPGRKLITLCIRRITYLGGHGEQCSNSEWNSSRNCVLIQPKWHPWNNDKHAARNVDGYKVIWKFAFENQFHFKTAIFPWNKESINYNKNITFLSIYFFGGATALRDLTYLYS